MKIVRDAAPGLDRAYRRVYEAGYRQFTDRMTITIEQAYTLTIRFAEPHHMAVAGGAFVEELRIDGWSWSTIYDDGNAITGAPIGGRFTHPMFTTRMGNAVKSRPAEWMVKGPMPNRELPLDKETIDRLAEEAAEIVRDMLRKQAFAETGELIAVDPLPVDDPLETRWDREIAEEEGDEVETPQPRPLYEVVPLDSDDEGNSDD